MYMEPQSLEVPHSLLAHHWRIAVPERDAQRELCYREDLITLAMSLPNVKWKPRLIGRNKATEWDDLNVHPPKWIRSCNSLTRKEELSPVQGTTSSLKISKLERCERRSQATLLAANEPVP